MAKVEIYTKMFCPYCTRAMRLLGEKGVDIEEFDISMGGPKRAEMLGRAMAGRPCRRSSSTAPTSADRTISPRWNAPASSIRCWRVDARSTSPVQHGYRSAAERA
jgi:glutaredoxin